jgi:hypothetical protein
METAVFHQGAIASRSGMSSKAGVTEGFTVNQLDIFGDLKGNAIAIVIAGHAVPHHAIAGIIKIDGSSAAAVQVGILFLIAIYDDFLQGYIFRVDGAKDG